jgi:multiple sugar transport system substrate-binding protein
MVYHKAPLEAAGIKLPTNNWTWNDFFAFAKESNKQ